MRVNRSTVFCQITERHLPSQTMIGTTFNACWFANRLTLERLRACRLETLRPSRTVQSCPRWACRLERLNACELVLLTSCSSLGVWFPFLLLACELRPSSLQPSPFNRITVLHAPLIVDRFYLVTVFYKFFASACHIQRWVYHGSNRPCNFRNCCFD